MTSRRGTKPARAGARLQGILLACAYALLLLAPIADAWRGHPALADSASAVVAAAPGPGTAASERLGTVAADVDERVCELCALLAGGLRHAVVPASPSAAAAPLPRALAPVAGALPASIPLLALGSRAPPLT